MTGSTPRAMLTDAELRDHERDTGYGDDVAYVPTAAALAHFGVSQPRERTSFVGTLPAGEDRAAGESTAHDLGAEGQERPEGDAARALSTRPSLLARRPLRDENDTPAARGLAIAFIASAAMWAGALALAADLGAFR